MTKKLLPTISGLKLSFPRQFILAGISFLAALVMGVLVFFVNELNWQANALEQQVKIVAFLEEGIDQARQDQLQAHLSSLPDLGSVQFISKKDAAEKVRSAGALGESMWTEHNPFPASFVLVPKQISHARVDAMSKAIEQLDNVEEVVADMEGARRMDVVRLHERLLLVVGAVFLLLLTMGFLVRLWALFGERLWQAQLYNVGHEMLLGWLGSGAALMIHKILMGPIQDFGVSGSRLSGEQMVGILLLGGGLSCVLGQLSHPGNHAMALDPGLLEHELDLDWHFKDIASKNPEELVSKS